MRPTLKNQSRIHGVRDKDHDELGLSFDRLMMRRGKCRIFYNFILMGEEK
jgi:hypothetical protein